MDASDFIKANALVWISSLREQELGVTKRIIEDLDPFLKSNNIIFLHYNPNSKYEFVNHISDIEKRCRLGLRPIIHIDMHGDHEEGLLVVASNENITWESVISYFRRINQVTQNNLCVISTACFGFHVLQARNLDVSNAAPFYALLASEKQILAGDVQEYTLAFYRLIFDKLDLGFALQRSWGDKLRRWRAEDYMFDVIVNFILKYAKGRNRKNWIEKIVSEGRAANIVNSSNISHFRKYIREYINSYDTIIRKVRADFYMGRKISFDSSDINKAISEVYIHMRSKRNSLRYGNKFFTFRRR